MKYFVTGHLTQLLNISGKLGLIRAVTVFYGIDPHDGITALRHFGTHILGQFCGIDPEDLPD